MKAGSDIFMGPTDPISDSRLTSPYFPSARLCEAGSSQYMAISMQVRIPCRHRAIYQPNIVVHNCRANIDYTGSGMLSNRVVARGTRPMCELVWHLVRENRVRRACGSFNQDRVVKMADQACLTKRCIWKKAHATHPLIRTEEIGTRILVLLCTKCFCYSSSRAKKLPMSCPETSSYPEAFKQTWIRGVHPVS
jgi:hypothetical protein